MMDRISRAAAGPQQNSPQNNPMARIAQARRSGMSPMQFVQQNLQRTPQAQQAMQILSGDQNQLRAMAENIAQQRGIDLNAFVQQASYMI